MKLLKHLINKHRLEVFVVFFLIVVAILYFSNGTRAQAPLFTRGQTLNPTCVAGTPGCTVAFLETFWSGDSIITDTLSYDFTGAGVTATNSSGAVTVSIPGGGGDFSDGGEAGGADRTLGNTDNFDLSFITKNLTRLHIQDDGNVGIGDISPDALLEIASFAMNASDLFMVSSIDTEDGDIFIVKKSGNVGIGTADPLQTLQVEEDGGGLYLSAGSAAGTKETNIYWGASEDATDAWMRFNFEYNSGDIIFERSPNGQSPWSDIMTLDWGDSRVGIGTVSPGELLHVSGGDVAITDPAGGASDTAVILVSPNANCWRITVDNTGTLNTASVTCP